MHDWALMGRIAALATLALGLLWWLCAVITDLGVRRLVRLTLQLEAKVDALQAEVRQLHASHAPADDRQADWAPRSEPARSQGGGAYAAHSTHFAYDVAARLAANGAPAAELVTQCGLTPAEAELAVRVHGSRVRSASVA
jgi:hypothetical protein